MNPGGSRVTNTITRHPWIAGVTGVYVAAWTIYGFSTGARLAIPYLIWLLFTGGVVLVFDRRVRFSTEVLVLLSISGFAHMAGGNVVIDGSLLYESTWLGFLGYDHLLHVLGLGTAGLAVWEATTRMFRAFGGWPAAVITFLGAHAVGTAIEIGEYLSYLTIEAANVGDYANNMQDLIANMVGALLAAWWASRAPRGIPRP
ncbi:MAG: hypothetical protein F4035_09515 [Acidimicrobiia bacterium]|nr:hypothetical protein [Acidimicrobiia bacterium]MYK56678.1 hypothetical protein [Acidimicrobiia bacterium]